MDQKTTISSPLGWVTCSIRRCLAIAACGALVLGGGLAHAAGWSGEVSHVSDGDTIWVRRAHQHEAQSVRIDGIDAPEICQAFGVEARAALSAHLLGQRVHVTERAHDQYGRTVARVKLAGTDVGGWMVQQGYAWSYRYRRHGGPYARAEAHARELGLGLFAEPNPLPPREFRQKHGSCHAEKP